MDYREKSRIDKELAESKMALFTNFTGEEFTGYWDGKLKHTLKPGESRHMQAYLAAHFAKVLTNRELVRLIKNKETGEMELAHKDGEKMTSPKKPEQVPVYMELYKQAYKPDDDDEEKEPEDAGLSSNIEPIEDKDKAKDLQPPVDEEEKFEGAPVEDEDDKTN